MWGVTLPNLAISISSKYALLLILLTKYKCIMRRKRSLRQIILILEKRLNGGRVKDLCEEAAISTSTFHRWEEQYKEIVKDYIKLKSENDRLRKMYTNLSVLHDSLHEAFNFVLNDKAVPVTDQDIQKKIHGRNNLIQVQSELTS